MRKMFSRPVRSGWKPAPSSNRALTRPFIRIRPLFGRNIRAISFRMVLLPLPLRPTMPKHCPGSTSKLTSRTAHSDSVDFFGCLRRENSAMNVSNTDCGFSLVKANRLSTFWKLITGSKPIKRYVSHKCLAQGADVQLKHQTTRTRHHLSYLKIQLCIVAQSGKATKHVRSTFCQR